LEKLNFWCCLGGVSTVTKEIDYCSETFLLLEFFFFFGLCASVMPLGQYIVAKAGCN
jgi:hypothetical protein